MILSDETIDVTTNLNGPSLAFEIDQTSSLMFSVLRNRMYTNPIYSIVREYSTNARDAQIEAGKEDEPISVYVPGDFLIIQDSGLGISPERMRDVCRFYGRSTKRNDNTQHGAFGLGLKCAFSLPSSDHFLINTHSGGIRYEYLAYIDSTQIGDIKLLQAEESSGIGTEIKIPVKYSERGQFREACNYYYQFWKIPPVLHGHTLRKDWEIKYQSKNGDWFITNKRIPNVNCLLDVIPYEFSFARTNEEITNNQFNCIPENLVLVFQTGAIEPTATRENLQSNDANSDAYRKQLSLALKEINQMVMEKVKDTTDVFTIYQTYHDFNIRPNFQFASQTFDSETKIRCYYKGYSRNTLSSTRISSAISYGKVIEDISDFTPYRKGLLNKYLRDNSLAGVFLIKPEEISQFYTTPPTIPCLSGLLPTTIKKTTQPRTAKTKILVRKPGNWGQAKELDIASATPVVYDSMKNESNHNRSGGMGDVWLVRQCDLKFIEGQPNWVRFADYIRNEIAKLNLTEAELQDLNQEYQINRFLNKFGHLDKEVPEINHYVKIKNKAAKLINWQRWLNLGHTYGILPYAESSFKTFEEKFYERFPLLGQISEYDINKKDVEDYVNMVKIYNSLQLNKGAVA